MGVLNKLIGLTFGLFLIYLIVAQGSNVNQILQGLGEFNAKTLNALRS